MKNYQEIEQLEEKLIEILGIEEFLKALTKAMSYDTKLDYYEYICKNYDINE